MSSNQYAYYLKDLAAHLKEMTLEAKKAAKAAKSQSERKYERGRLMAMVEVLSLMRQQADAFAIPRKELRLHDIDPERDLL
jgi:hypothetical protein